MSELSLPPFRGGSSTGSAKESLCQFVALSVVLLGRAALAVFTRGAVRALSEGLGVHRLASAFFLASSASRSRNSFCLTSNAATPSGVMSANAGDREREALVLSVRRRFEGVLVSELELFASLRANMIAGRGGIVIE